MESSLNILIAYPYFQKTPDAYIKSLNRVNGKFRFLLDSGALSSTEALQYGSFVRNLPPPSNTYGLSPEIKPGIEGINLQGNFPGVL